MSMRMAIDAPHHVRAIAPFIINLFSDPVPVPNSLPLPPAFLYMGTNDPISTFAGTSVRLSARDTVEYFADNTFSVTSPPPAFTMLTDTDPTDGCQIFEQPYEDAAGNPTVIYYEGDGGGHTVPDPNGTTNPVRGTLCRDANGIDLAFGFFQSLN